MVAGVFGRAPDTGDAKLTAAAVGIVIWAVNAAPCMAAAYLNAPPVLFGIAERFFNFFFRMFLPSHLISPLFNGKDIHCDYFWQYLRAING
ncbi:MAG: hypothetical protein ACRCTU_08885 [Zoogloea sp.]|uniref:hypothetical protein n=1 Tax=Zoogloea sp. TaxID=49181 RepID=UPI003F3CC202